MVLNEEFHLIFSSLIWNLYSIISQATKSQMEWEQLKFRKVEMKKGV